MAKKRVYAAVEIADQEVRLVVLEVFDARNNILRVEKVPCSGIENSRIVDEAAVVKAIQQAVKQAQSALGYRIERVLLAIPAADILRSTQKIHITIEDGTRNIRRFHVQQGLNKALQKKTDDQHDLVNVNSITYVINDIPTAKLPIGQEADAFDMEVDLLYANKEILYSYAKAIEQANLEILDICLDAYAQGQESGVLAQAKSRPIILVSLEADHTTLSLFMQERLVTASTLDKGFRSFAEDFQKEYNLDWPTAFRLLRNLFSSKEEDASDVIIYIEQQENRRIEITSRQLAQSVLPKIRAWIAEVNAASEPIVESGNAKYVISGQGSSIPVIEDMEKAFNAPASVYKVTSIGARDGSYATALGMSYAWQELNKIRNEEQTSVNNNELEASIESINRYTKDEDGGFTQKLRRVMLASNE